MKFKVNEDLCIACGACTGISNCFKIVDKPEENKEVAEVAEKIEEKDLEAVKDAMEGCPVGAIEEVK